MPKGGEGDEIGMLGAGTELKRSLTVASVGWTYPAADMLSDFGAGASTGVIEVSQVGVDGLPGFAAAISISIEV